MSNHFYRYTSTNPYLHERMMALENEELDRLLLRRAELGPIPSNRGLFRRRVARSLRAWADRLETPARVARSSTVASWDWAWDDLVRELGFGASGMQSSASPVANSWRDAPQECGCEPGG
jgi:hypothetical protein